MRLLPWSKSRRNTNSAFARAARYLDEITPLADRVDSIPTYLVMGPKSSGKTTLINKSNLESILHFGDDAPQLSGSTCGINLLRGGILVDVDGSLLAETDPALTRVSDWNHLLKLLGKYRPRRPLNGIVLTISAADLLSPTGGPLDSTAAVEEKARILRARLAECQRATQLSLPIYVVVTQSDRIEYFRDYFSPFPASVSDHILGWSSPHPIDYDFSEEWIVQAFADLKGHLEQRGLDLLGERQLSRIPEGFILFPKAFGDLERGARAFCKVLFEENIYQQAFLFRGLYFTGDLNAPSRESAANLDETAMLRGRFQTVSRVRSLDETAKPAANPRLLFVKELFEKRIFAESRLAFPIDRKDRQLRPWQRVVLVSSILFSLIWAIGMRVGYLHLQKAKKDLAIYFEDERKHVATDSTIPGSGAALDLDREVAALMRLNNQLGPSRLRHWALPASWLDQAIPSWSVFDSVSANLAACISSNLFSDLRVAYDGISKSLANSAIDEYKASHADDAPFLFVRGYAEKAVEFSQATHAVKILQTNGKGDLQELVDLSGPRLGARETGASNKVVSNPLVASALKRASFPAEEDETFARQRETNLITLFARDCERVFARNPYKLFAREINATVDKIASVRSPEAPRNAPLLQETPTLIPLLDSIVTNLDAIARRPDPVFIQAIQQSNVLQITAISNVIGYLDRNRSSLNTNQPSQLLSLASNAMAAFKAETTNSRLASLFAFPTDPDNVDFSQEFKTFTNIVRRVDAHLKNTRTTRDRYTVAKLHAFVLSINTLLTNSPLNLEPPSSKTSLRAERQFQAELVLLDYAIYECLGRIVNQDAAQSIDGLLADLEAQLATDTLSLPDDVARLKELSNICQARGLSSRTPVEDAICNHYLNVFERLDDLTEREGIYKPEFTSAANLHLMRNRLAYLSTNFASPLIKQIQLTQKLPPSKLRPKIALWSGILDGMTALPMQTPNNPLLKLEDYIRLATKTTKVADDLPKLSDDNLFFAARKETVDFESDFPTRRWEAWQAAAQARLAAERANPFELYRLIQLHFNSRLAGKFPFCPRNSLPDESVSPTDVDILFRYLDQYQRLDKSAMSLQQFASGINRPRLDDVEAFIAALEHIRPWFYLNAKSDTFANLKVSSDTLSILFNNGSLYKPLTQWPPSEWSATTSNSVHEVFISLTPPVFPGRPTAAPTPKLGGSDFAYFDSFFDGGQLVYRARVQKPFERLFPIRLAQQFSEETEIDLSAVPLRPKSGCEAVLSLTPNRTIASLEFPKRAPQLVLEAMVP